MTIDFHASAARTLGIEWELQVVDLETRGLVSAGSTLLTELAHLGEQATAELFENTVEIVTGVHTTVPSALKDLENLKTQVADHARAHGWGVMCAGAHPFTRYVSQEVSPGERYQNLVRRMRWPARRLQINGVHVHVGVRGADEAVRTMSALTAYLPHLLALSASSPFWEAEDTGLASCRTKVFEGMPTAGLPDPMDDWGTYEQHADALLKAGAIETIKEIWWDIRPHPGYGTVELRMCDGIPTLAEVGMIAALAQCLVDEMDSLMLAGETLQVPAPWVARENKWRAARHGLAAQLLTDSAGSSVPLVTSLSELVERLLPRAEVLGCAEQLTTVLAVIEHGNSATRQRAAATAAGGNLEAVVDHLMAEMEAGTPVL